MRDKAAHAISSISTQARWRNSRKEASPLSGRGTSQIDGCFALGQWPRRDSDKESDSRKIKDTPGKSGKRGNRHQDAVFYNHLVCWSTTVLPASDHFLSSGRRRQVKGRPTFPSRRVWEGIQAPRNTPLASGERGRLLLSLSGFGESVCEGDKEATSRNVLPGIREFFLVSGSSLLHLFLLSFVSRLLFISYTKVFCSLSSSFVFPSFPSSGSCWSRVVGLGWDACCSCGFDDRIGACISWFGVGEGERKSSCESRRLGIWTAMEQKRILMSALGVGIGVGVGLGLASGPKVGKWTSSSSATNSERIEQELHRQIVDGKESNVTFDEFPYFLNEQTRVLLTSAAYVHLKQADFSKHTRNLSPASRAILLSGPAELYQQMLAKALAHYFEAKLLLLDTTDFSLKLQNKYGNRNSGIGSDSSSDSLKRSISEVTLGRMSSFLSSFSLVPPREELKGTLRRQSSGMDLRSRGSEGMQTGVKLRRNASAAADISSLASQGTPVNTVPLRRTTSWAFDEKVFVQSLYKVLVTVSKTRPIVLYIRDIENLLFRSQRVYSLFQRMLKKLSGPVLILGSRTLEPGNDYGEVDEKLSLLFPYNIEIKSPEDENHLVSWKTQLEEDMRMIQFQDNRNHITEVLAANDLDCDDLASICLADTMILSKYIEEIVVSAVSYHLMNNKDPEYKNGKLVISSKSLAHGLSIFQESKHGGRDTLKLEASTDAPKANAVEDLGDCVKPETKSEASAPENKNDIEKSAAAAKNDGSNLAAPPKEVPPDNEFEKRIRPEVIPASEIGVTFADIGGIEEIKESIQELVMLPLRRPDLFKGGLLKPCRGILLFGPPGTGKTMLAKAIAKEAGASFINVSMSTITSKWFGEDEKNVRALFTLAAKVSPTIIFVDEVDSMLGQRSRVGEHEAMRKIKNEFMTHWDGLLSKSGERILVLAATNRPFDLDEAIIRRFERRIMVSLPSAENREKILRTLLSKEKADELDFTELAAMTDGYSGSDLKNLCTTAAYRPVRELIQHEIEKERKKKAEGIKAEEEADTCEENKEESATLRPLTMEDMRLAKNQVAASFAAEGSIMNDLKQWNDLYGEGGSRKKQQLSYFL